MKWSFLTTNYNKADALGVSIDSMLQSLPEDGELVETVDARDSRAVNCELLNYLTVDQDPVVRARLGLEDEEPAESYQQL